MIQKIKSKTLSNTMIPFGKLLVETKRKKTYSCSAYELEKMSSTIKIYDGQRSFDSDRMKVLYKHELEQYKKYKEFDFRGTILMCKLPEENTYSIVDGQHRYFCICRLIGENYPDFNVIVEIVYVNSQAEMFEEFQNVNKSVPVPLCCTSPDDIINTATKMLQRKFPKAFNNLRRRPKINLEDFKSALIEDKLVDRCKLDQKSLYEGILLLQNSLVKLSDEKILEKIARKDKKENDFVKRWLPVCRDNSHLFIGLYKQPRWIKELEAILKKSK